MMIHNHRAAIRAGLEPTHIMMASPYLYAFRSGLEKYIGEHDCALPDSIYPLNPTWFWHAQAQADTRLAALARHLGVELRIGRADGVFLTAALFDEMLALIHRFFEPSELDNLDPLYPIEELLFPTLLPALLGTAGRIGATAAKVWKPDDPISLDKLRAVLSAGRHRCGKRIPQSPADPMRQMVLAKRPGLPALSQKLGTTTA